MLLQNSVANHVIEQIEVRNAVIHCYFDNAIKSICLVHIVYDYEYFAVIQLILIAGD